jgi:hypothetical protein
MKPLRLHDMLGEMLVGIVPVLDAVDGGPHIEFRLISVDVGGIWVESQSFTEMILKTGNKQASEKSPALFLPFSSISYLARIHDVPALSEKGFGLTHG